MLSNRLASSSRPSFLLVKAEWGGALEYIDIVSIVTARHRYRLQIFRHQDSDRRRLGPRTLWTAVSVIIILLKYLFYFYCITSNNCWHIYVTFTTPTYFFTVETLKQRLAILKNHYIFQVISLQIENSRYKNVMVNINSNI